MALLHRRFGERSATRHESKPRLCWHWTVQIPVKLRMKNISSVYSPMNGLYCISFHQYYWNQCCHHCFVFLWFFLFLVSVIVLVWHLVLHPRIYWNSIHLRRLFYSSKHTNPPRRLPECLCFASSGVASRVLFRYWGRVSKSRSLWHRLFVCFCSWRLWVSFEGPYLYSLSPVLMSMSRAFPWPGSLNGMLWMPCGPLIKGRFPICFHGLCTLAEGFQVSVFMQTGPLTKSHLAPWCFIRPR